MEMEKKSGNMVSSWFAMKCPRCRTGRMFINKSVFPLKDMMKMPVKCHCCGQRMEPEPGFYYGTGYMSYAVSCALLVFNAIWWALFIGFSWDDNSLYWYLAVTVVMLVVLQPWIMRISRVLYLAMFVKYVKDHPVLDPNEKIEVLQEGYIQPQQQQHQHAK